ncbi:hypothetical protein [Brochothrix thermosphacta]|uniref:hypothetical protein n=1 Tax=Brochothrix thermosphacta TaxID=2756 RepID=UPI003F9AC408
MTSAAIMFSNGVELTVTEDTKFIGIRSSDANVSIPGTDKENDTHKFIFPKSSTSIENIEIYDHIHYGLIPSLTELFLNYDFLSLSDSKDIAYSTKSIVSVRNNSSS